MALWHNATFLRFIHVLHVWVLCSFVLLSHFPSDGCTAVCITISLLMDIRVFPIYSYYEYGYCEHSCGHMCLFYFWGSIPRTNHRYIFNFLRKWQIILQTNCTILYSLQWPMGFLLLHLLTDGWYSQVSFYFSYFRGC